MRMLITGSHAPGDTERETIMRKVNQTAIGRDVYTLLQGVRMSDRDRHVSINALRVAEGFAVAAIWVKEKLAAMGTWFLKPSVKH
jgi:hypothetical protein